MDLVSASLSIGKGGRPGRGKGGRGKGEVARSLGTNIPRLLIACPVDENLRDIDKVGVF